MATEKPNILFIMADQAIAALTGAYGHPIVKTPNLDNLASRGVRFDSAYTPYPLCAPGRASMMTGLHASRIGAWDNGASFGSDVPTIPHYLSNEGYDTVLSGKMHFTGADQLHGYDRRMNTDIYPADFVWVKPEWIDIKENAGRDYESIMGNRQNYNASNYVGEAVHVGRWHNPLAYDEETHFRAVQYLRARANRPEPFFLTVSYHHPHEPFWPPKTHWDMYEGDEIEIPQYPDDLEDRESMMDRWLNAYHGTRRFNLGDPASLTRLHRAYYAQMTYMDDKVGELISILDDTGLLDNTVIVFTTDHGDMLGERLMVQKRCFYEYSCRVPLIVCFPDQRGAGTTVDTPVSLVDLLPTFCEVAGAPVSHPHDGDSLVPLIDGSDADRHIFAQAHEAVGSPCIMVRQGKYKYVYIHGYPAQLFDLSADPGEWNNLAGNPDYSQVESQLRSLILSEFDPEQMAADNLTSLKRRALIRDVMTRQGHSWAHFPEFNARRGAADQHLKLP